MAGTFAMASFALPGLAPAHTPAPMHVHVGPISACAMGFDLGGGIFDLSQTCLIVWWVSPLGRVVAPLINLLLSMLLSRNQF